MVEALTVTDPTAPGIISDVAVDSISAGLLAGFVGLLFLGYFDPSVPYSGFAILPLMGSLGLLFWMNRKADRTDRSQTAAANG